MALALALAGYDTAQLDTFEDALCHDQSLKTLQDKIHVHGDENLSEMQARLHITGQGGVEHAFHDLDTSGPIATRKTRLLAKITSLHGDTWANEVQQMVYGGNPDLGALAPLMQKGP